MVKEHNEKLFTRTFSLYLASTIINFLGTGMHGIALPWLLLEMTKSPLSIGILLCIRALPGIFLAPYAGYVADCMDRRINCFLMNLLQGIVVFVTVGLGYYGLLNQFYIYSMALLISIGNTFFFPGIRAYIQEVVGKANLLRANSLTESLTQAGMLIGTGTAGLVISSFGTMTALFIDGCTFLVSAICIILMNKTKASFSVKPQKFAILKTQFEVLKYVKTKFILFVTILLLLVPTFCVQVNNVLVGAFTMDLLKLDASAYGLINLCYAIGAMLSGFILASLTKKRVNDKYFIFVSILALGLFEGLFGSSQNLSTAMLITFIIGSCVVITRTWLNTKVMSITDNEYAGRIQSTIGFLTSVMLLVSGLVVGGIAKNVGYNLVFYLLGTFVVLIAFISLFYYSRQENATTTSNTSEATVKAKVNEM
ncbi:MFS transporter [Aneurinibacillus thermoaerophilus]|uniref:Predicted arabinose efflux permease, MFS family n=1 Tax=Aneurinibacillus thermoaerophilus TaxID=143495 RepID=A0A1G8F3U8_ANETH|nr:MULTISPECIES: MFS transporter [Aneurinibacillus]AMA73427.1 hypothetical protein ACH33_11555 [Aneurinibacillus sp. XH2]MED0677653.1 MFS transporter [Aneurinibacillus thermoaerophilus]MED0758913.1 MFS transporter [Aneurinibacillus thermoaerophilus]MED0760627.1 MFS transporter [Aneurinibacillus thermoaerophilus]SDH76689.1 Predicted arabinose efflux permease, MFS family [Aneurinibacillus thermoaerophilus]